MSQAARDPLFYACLAIANQDAPESGDLCIRCHSPDGWLAGRSVPTDGSILNNNDRQGVQCDFCHKLVKPTQLSVNPYPTDPDYTADTYPRDQEYLSILSEIPPASANGMYVADSDNAKRGPYVDAAARHQMFYSPFHQDAAICGTCHDVSNPAFVKEPDGSYSPNEFGQPAPSFDPYTMFPIERTYSEWLMSDYNTPEGIHAPQFGGNKEYVSTCQDCHLRDVSGKGCNKRGAPFRDDLPLHDMTGGNTFIPPLVEQLYPDEVDPVALAAGVQRSTEMLQKAASFDLDVTTQGAEFLASVRVTNETGHKLPSGYPEGRRIWINLVAYDTTGVVIYESGAYDPATGILTHDADAKIYEIKPGISAELAPIVGLPEGPSFHFVLNNQIFSDNRIPPRGFTNANFEMIQSPPVGYSYPDGQYWDDTEYTLPEGSARVVATLYYQTTSKEYVEFLRDENVTNDWGQVLFDLWNTTGKSAPVVMSTETYDIVPPGTDPPVADFVGDPTSGTAPLTVSFTDLSINSPTSWSWDFGDMGTSTEQNPTYTYTAVGTYTVSLTASNAFGTDTETKVDYIAVTEPGGGTTMHVSDIAVTREQTGGNRIRGVATVTIVDQTDAPVSGATVTGDFTGPTSGTKSGTTDADGHAILRSKAIKNPVGDWCFEVTDVSLPGATYDPSANVVTQACEGGLLHGASCPMAMGAARGFGLGPNHPNPFNPKTEIVFTLPTSQHVKLEIYNISGQRVATLADRSFDAGSHSVTWDAGSAASGFYYCRLTADGGVDVRTLTLLK
jgi:PKD repeat protein